MVYWKSGQLVFRAPYLGRDFSRNISAITEYLSSIILTMFVMMSFFFNHEHMPFFNEKAIMLIGTIIKKQYQYATREIPLVVRSKSPLLKLIFKL